MEPSIGGHLTDGVLLHFIPLMIYTTARLIRGWYSTEGHVAVSERTGGSCASRVVIFH